MEIKSFPRGPYSLGVLSICLMLAGCAGGSLPGVVSPTAQSLVRSTRPVACPAAQNSLKFNASPIARGSWIWFSSVVSVPGAKGTTDVSMSDSYIRFRVGQSYYWMTGPTMRLSLSQRKSVRFAFDGAGYDWQLEAPFATAGRDFLNGIFYRTQSALPGNISDVTWSAKFHANTDRKIEWKWSATVYSKFSGDYGKLGVKPLGDERFPPHNSDRAGTPEAYRDYAVDGATNGALGPSVSVTPCGS